MHFNRNFCYSISHQGWSKNMIQRWQEGEICRAMAVRRGVHLTGARQSGKTTLAKFVSAGNMRHVSLDEQMYLRTAKSDPAAFVERIDGRPMVIDEIQKAPELLDAIKIQVDNSNDKGQFLLTGSSNLRFMKSVKDSLAGRLKTIRLRTLTLGELRGTKGEFLNAAFAHEFPNVMPRLDKRGVINLAFRSGYPEAMELDVHDRRGWFEDYLADLLIKDIQDITEIRKVSSLRNVAEWLLAYSSKFFDVSDLCAQAHIAKVTADNYLCALKALYVFDGLEPWSKSDYAKIGKRVKYYAADPGLVANLLGWDEDRTFYDDDANGKLVETWVYHELAALTDKSLEYKMSQYRDSDKREIDFIVERDDGALLGIEVKAGNASNEDFKHLKWFSKNLAKGPFTGIVLYSGRDVLSFGSGMFAVPLSALGI